MPALCAWASSRIRSLTVARSTLNADRSAGLPSMRNPEVARRGRLIDRLRRCDQCLAGDAIGQDGRATDLAGADERDVCAELTSNQRPFVSARAIADDDHARRLGHAPILSRTFSAAAAAFCAFHSSSFRALSSAAASSVATPGCGAMFAAGSGRSAFEFKMSRPSISFPSLKRI